MSLRHIVITSATVSSLLLLAGAGCSSSTTTNTNTTANTNTTTANTNTTKTNTNKNTANVNTTNTNTATVNSNANTNVADTTEANTNEANTNDTPVVDTETTESTVKEFDVTARQFEFDPSTITVDEGDTVKLNVTSEDTPHGISIAAFGVSQTLTPNSTKTIEFVADKAGTYPIVCSVVCGSGHSSMKATLVVQ